MSTTTTTTKKFRIDAKKFFLTFSQCACPPSVVKERIKDLFKERLDYTIIGQEHHKDGNLHLHVLIVLKYKFNCRNPRFFDQLTGTHGKYEAARNESNCIKYICKEGFKIEAEGIDWQEALKLVKRKQSTKSAKVALMVMDSQPLEEINEEFPGYMLLHHQQIASYQQFLKNLKNLKRPLIPWSGCHLPNSQRSSMNGWERKIISWLNLNMAHSRPHKQPQLWVHGPTGAGKSLLLFTLLKHFNGYEIPDDNGWFEDYDDEYHFIYCDEYNDRLLAPRTINQLAEGTWMKLKRRGRAPYHKQKNLPLIICSNKTIDEIYATCTPRVLEAIKKRFEEIEIPEGKVLRLQTEFESSDEDTQPLYFSEDEDEFGSSADHNPFE
jgi:hypothetical protein